jgi:hypothetical protein
MLGRNSYTKEELENAKRAVKEQLASYRKLAKSVGGASADKKLPATLDALEVQLFNNMTLVLDRYFVHRLRTVTGKDANPLNEVELLADSLINNDGVFRANKVIKVKPEETVLKLEPGERVALSADQFEQLARAFLGEIDAKFV